MNLYLQAMQPYIRATVAWCWADTDAVEAALCDAQDELLDALECWHEFLEVRP